MEMVRVVLEDPEEYYNQISNITVEAIHDKCVADVDDYVHDLVGAVIRRFIMNDTRSLIDWAVKNIDDIENKVAFVAPRIHQQHFASDCNSRLKKRYKKKVGSGKCYNIIFMAIKYLDEVVRRDGMYSDRFLKQIKGIMRGYGVSCDVTCDFVDIKAATVNYLITRPDVSSVINYINLDDRLKYHRLFDRIYEANVNYNVTSKYLNILGREYVPTTNNDIHGTKQLVGENILTLSSELVTDIIGMLADNKSLKYNEYVPQLPHIDEILSSQIPKQEQVSMITKYIYIDEQGYKDIITEEVFDNIVGIGNFNNLSVLQFTKNGFKLEDAITSLDFQSLVDRIYNTVTDECLITSYSHIRSVKALDRRELGIKQTIISTLKYYIKCLLYTYLQHRKTYMYTNVKYSLNVSELYQNIYEPPGSGGCSSKVKRCIMNIICDGFLYEHYRDILKTYNNRLESTMSKSNMSRQIELYVDTDFLPID